MARPKKEKELRRTHPVMLRFTDTEYERLLFLQKPHGFLLQNISENKLQENQ